ncbi:tripeptidyl peptidase [Moniliophthora roreri]|nr:tripeptidyl peptidase [Moniliophthora roreri]
MSSPSVAGAHFNAIFEKGLAIGSVDLCISRELRVGVDFGSEGTKGKGG